MTAAEILAQLRDRGIEVWAEGDRLRYRAPRGSLTDDLRRGLAEQKAELLALLAEEPSDERTGTIPRAPRDAPLPLSFVQERFWLLNQLDPDSPAYNIPIALRARGALDVGAFGRSVDEIVRRHEILRTTFPSEDGAPVQVILPEQHISLDTFDLTDLPAGEAYESAMQAAVEYASVPFSVADGPLLRAAVWRLAEEDHLLLLVTHHLAADGWSVAVVYRELAALYGAFTAGRSSPLPDPPVQYADYAHWQRKRVREPSVQEQFAYWRRRLEGAPTELDLPTDRPREDEISYAGGACPLELDAELSDALRELSRSRGATLFMTMLAALQALLHRYTGQHDLIVATAASVRNRTELEDLIGTFVNTLLMRADFAADPTFAELLDETRQAATRAYANQEAPYEVLMDDLHPERVFGRAPLFQVMFLLHRHNPAEVLRLPGLEITDVKVHLHTAMLDMGVTVHEGRRELRGWIAYSTDLFDADTVERFFGHFGNLLAAVAADPDCRVSELPILSDAERHEILVDWNDTAADYSTDCCIHELVDAQVERTPDAVAVVCGDRQIRFRELNARANRFAGRLREAGVGPDVPVGVCLERSLEMVIALLGVLKAGGAYAPLDPLHPSERLAEIIADSGMPVVVTSQEVRDRLPDHEAREICVEPAAGPVPHADAAMPEGGASADSLAYVIYTSGSTGRPKGVMVPHRAVCNYLLWRRSYFPLDESDALLHTASFTFDDSVWQFFEPLMTGARMVLARADEQHSSRDLVRLMREHDVTAISLVPSELRPLLREPGIADCAGLRRVTTGGEMVSAELQALFFSVFDADLYNIYGPTETAIGVTCWRCNPDRPEARVPIGRPIANVQVYVLDTHMEPVPPGVIGEIYVGGAALARGYLNRPEETAAAFVPDPFSAEPDARLYKTGDLGRCRPDGVIEMVGRSDDQVKVRGARIELGEIRSVLERHPAVDRAAAIVREESGERVLAAYAAPDSGEQVEARELSEFLRAALPSFMVPRHIVVLEELPLTSSGKVDRQALPVPEPVGPREEPGRVMPRDALEYQLQAIWDRILGIRHVGVRDNFFELGGDSMAALRLIPEIEWATGRRLPAGAVFHAPTIEQQAELMRAEGWRGCLPALVPLQPNGSKPPLFAVTPITAWSLRRLARHMEDDQPLYGLQPMAFVESHGFSAPVRRMAADFLREVRSVQPVGPYRLLGLCAAGPVTFEMAQQLRRAGERVEFLGLLDSSRPVPLRRPYFLSIRLRLLRRRLHGASALSFTGRIGRIAREVGRLFGKGSPRPAAYVDPWSPDGGAGPEAIRGGGYMARLIWALLCAQMFYRPERYDGKITLVFADEREGLPGKDRRGAWRDLAGGGIERHDVPGAHGQCLAEPHVQTLAAVLTDCLARAAGE